MNNTLSPNNTLGQHGARETDFLSTLKAFSLFLSAADSGMLA